MSFSKTISFYTLLFISVKCKTLLFLKGLIMEFIENHFQDLIALIILLICLIALIFKKKKSKKLEKTLNWIIASCLGFILRGNV
jgi:hypothetical protein